MRLRHLPLALALAAGCLATGPAANASSSAAAFDAALAAGHAPAFALEYDGVMHQIAGLDRLEVELEGPDGQPGAIYAAQVDGRPATIVRLGDRLDIAYDDEKASAAGRAKRSGEWIPDYAGLDDLAGMGDENPPDPEADQPGGDGLNVWIFLHDNANEPDHARFVNWYTAWWLKEMKNDVIPGKPVRVFLKTRVPGLTDLDYHAGTQVERLHDVHLRGFEYVDGVGGHPGPLTRYMLFVDKPAGNWGSNAVGVALDRGKSAMASRTGPRHIVAHELGHTIGGVHEHAQTFPCASSMAGYVLATISCRWYTSANQRNIREFLTPLL
ncbi:hypothetical protein [Luteibacter sp. 329MFSha]|uniref:hypothetical protein n=1 Tax=Luteibacter sp. 329MFSha TaxID=1798239 RepID=UPI0008C75FA8|nr:hypothetical protein [Luteibacter sp. 329MFSha]SEW17240.1 hypothetical protein SAMN04515660_2779 [Luteibacter sp. 329MFSha]